MSEDPAQSHGASAHPDAWTRVRLRATGYDEVWLQNRFAAEPALLGLGDVRVVGQEVGYTAAGNLDILAARDRTYFSIEVQLDAVDASHGFRVLEYWARNRERYPDKDHVAVLVAERTNNRYGMALQTLSEFLPLLVIELVARVNGPDLQITPHVVVANESLDVAATPAAADLADRTEQDWHEEAAVAAWGALGAFIQAVEAFGPVYVDYSARTHIGVRRGRRLWARVRLSATGIIVNLPDPDGGRVRGTPTLAFEAMTEAAAEVGVALAWQPASGGGAHPVNARLGEEDLLEGQVSWLLQACWEAFDHGVDPFIERYWRPGPPQAYSATEDWEGDFDPYYTVDYAEAGYGSTADHSLLIYWRTIDDSDTLWSVADADWTDEEFARRILVHHLHRQPPKALIQRFLRGPARDWEPGAAWSLSAEELAAWAHEWG